MWFRKWKFEIFTICGTISAYFLISSFLLNTFHSFDHSSSISEYTTNGIFGVNIYGWMNGDFGGGTTARCLVQSLMANNLPISAITINGADLHSHTNSMIQKLRAIATTPQNYLFDLLAINAANTLPILQDSSNQISSHRYRIGLWHWETSYLPDEQGILGGYYDEIWAPSEYVANAIISTPSFPSSVRVSIIPYGYESLSEFVTPQLRLVARSQLLSCIPSLKASQTSKSHQWPCPRCSKYTVPNMIQWSQSVSSSTSSTWRSSTSTTPAPVTPEAPYVTLFLVIFDFNSDFQRKNVLGIISAFRIAFPHSGDAQNTGLILKSSNGQHQPDDYRTLLSALDDYDEISRRIVFMDGVLSTTALKTLKRAVDCYISLHRSEGWGLNILESVLMGVPVIHTAFGGSEQFMKPLYEHSLPELRIPATMINVCSLTPYPPPPPPPPPPISAQTTLDHPSLRSLLDLNEMGEPLTGSCCICHDSSS
jgi:hypothetical protein